MYTIICILTTHIIRLHSHYNNMSLHNNQVENFFRITLVLAMRNLMMERRDSTMRCKVKDWTKARQPDSCRITNRIWWTLSVSEIITNTWNRKNITSPWVWGAQLFLYSSLTWTVCELYTKLTKRTHDVELYHIFHNYVSDRKREDRQRMKDSLQDRLEKRRQVCLQ